ncbi:MAG: hypothetical protein KatS3mg031_2802 [Chitinophagales bacterium]|nr:MAG: hypothetical protein KatS3mg031_2802 [Chitinophagales bacterium]
MFSVQGYKRNSPDRDKPYNIIKGGRITMQDVPHPVIAFPVKGGKIAGEPKMMEPGQEYDFGQVDAVIEIPLVEGMSEEHVKQALGMAMEEMGVAVPAAQTGTKLEQQGGLTNTFNKFQKKMSEPLKLFGQETQMTKGDAVAMGGNMLLNAGTNLVMSHMGRKAKKEQDKLYNARSMYQNAVNQTNMYMQGLATYAKKGGKLGCRVWKRQRGGTADTIDGVAGMVGGAVSAAGAILPPPLGTLASAAGAGVKAIGSTVASVIRHKEAIDKMKKETRKYLNMNKTTQQRLSALMNRNQSLMI